MANEIRIKRRATGNPGSPASLLNAELAFNEVDDVLYYGKGTGGTGGTATTVEAIAGRGAFVSLTGVQTISGDKTFSGALYAITQDAATNNTTVATTAFVKNQGYLTGNQTISITGDATGSGTTSIALTLAASGVTAGTYTKVTVDAKGRVTGGASLAATDIPALDAAKITTGTFDVLRIPTLTAAKISDFNTAVQTSRLDQMAAPTASVSLNNQKIINLADPVNDQDAANKRYVDAHLQGLSPKDSVVVATTANITLSGTQTIDGIAVAVGDRVLVKNQTTASENGIYVVASTAWSRSTDANTWDKLVSAFVFAERGTANADKAFLITVDKGGTLGTTSVTVGPFITASDVTAGTGISVSANQVSLAGQALALHNLTTSGFFVRTGTDTVAARSIAVSGSGIAITNGNGVSGNPTLSLSAALSTVGGLTPAADRIPYYTGASTAALTTLSAFGRSLIDDGDAASGRTTLGLGSMATQNSNSVTITGGSIDNIVIDGGTF